MSRTRALALATLLAALVIFGAVAGHLPDLPSGFDVAFHAVVVLPAFAAVIWLALPLARTTTRTLLALVIAAGGLAALLTLIGADSGANVAKLACYGLAGFCFLTLFEELWWLALVAALVPWVDIWSVAAGPTEYVVEQRPGIFERVAVALPNLGETATVSIGPPDVVFFGLFLAAAARFGLRVPATWLTMTGLLAATLVLVWAWHDVSGLPALPAVCLGFLLPNADLVWRDARRARATESP
ncbi:MAG TPA: hypothetical protein VHI53_10920 [Gaiellaceae bacterium]|nr:hypothetical protein [Gaiellaceae bacterium]